MSNSTVTKLSVLVAAMLPGVSNLRGQLLVDDFDGSAINSTRWTVSTPFPSSSVAVADGAAVFTHRGRLLSTATFPASLAITGRFQISGNSHDQFNIVTRTDGISTNVYGEFDTGLRFQVISAFANGSTVNNVGIAPVKDWVGYPPALATFPISVGTWYDFKIIDDGTTGQFFITDMTTPLVSLNFSTPLGSQLGIFNSEGADGGSTVSEGSISRLDRIAIVPGPPTHDIGLEIEKAVRVSFQTQQGKVYQLETSPATDPTVWSAVGGIVVGNGLRHDAGFLTESPRQAIFRVQEYDLTSGLVAYYPFNGNANDESGQEHHGTVQDASLSSDRFGNPNKAYAFDGSSAYISLPESTAFDSENFTISLWFRQLSWPDPSLPSREAQFLISKGQNNFELHSGSAATGNSGMRFLPRLAGGNHWDTPSATYQLNAWQHLVAIYEPSSNDVRFFLNGEGIPLSGPNTTAITPDNPSEARLGMRADGTLPFHGSLDSVRIYDRALSDGEVRALYGLSD